MAATDLKQLYNFKGAFCAATKSVLEAAGLNSVLIERSNESLPASRVEVTFDVGEASNTAVINDSLVYDYFTGCRLTIRLVTDRPEDQSSAIPGVVTLHDLFCASVYAALEERLTPFAAHLPYYTVNKCRPLAATSGLTARWLEDYTEIPFEVWFGIKGDAWPAS